MDSTQFGFGIEAEFLLVESESYNPLGYQNLDLKSLLQLVDAIPIKDISRNGFNQKPLHTQPSPYLIEGYTICDREWQPVDLLPKGIEIRTPLFYSFEECTDCLLDLYKRLQAQLLKDGMKAVIISHHPTLPRLSAPANYERYDYWQWALTATTTYGPDINISLPPSLGEFIDLEKLNERINYYGPAAIALTLASPIRESKLWSVNGKIGKSARTFERSKWAPIFYVHKKPSLRFEFKGFEMSRCLSDYHAMFLIVLALLLDEELTENASDEKRIQDLESISINGLTDPDMRLRATKVLESAQATARKFKFSESSLTEFWHRLETQTLPADNLIETFQNTQSIEKTLMTLTDFYDISSPPIRKNNTVCSN